MTTFTIMGPVVPYFLSEKIDPANEFGGGMFVGIKFQVRFGVSMLDFG